MTLWQGGSHTSSLTVAQCNLEHLTVHASVLNPGCCPHPPHAHSEEEILVVLDGEAVCVIPDSAEQPDPRTEVLRSGEFVYYPAYQYHTIRNASEHQIVYLMMKWRGRIASGPCQWSVPAIRPETFIPDPEKNFAVRGLMEFPTSYLAKLHAHQSVLQPGGGYEPHVDEHDVAIIVLSGLLETLDRTFGANSFLLHSAGVAHGIRNVGTNAARYLVFEFHAETVGRSDRIKGTQLLDQPTAAQAHAALAGEKAALAREKAALEAALAAVWASSSWRITAPLRGMSRLVRRRPQTQPPTNYDRMKGTQLFDQPTAAQAHDAALAGEKAALAREKAALEAALAAVWASSSWRITAPLRAISRLVRRRPQTQPPCN